jgi:hypothetical protein
LALQFGEVASSGVFNRDRLAAPTHLGPVSLLCRLGQIDRRRAPGALQMFDHHQAARFPNYRDLAGFDFASSEVNDGRCHTNLN